MAQVKKVTLSVNQNSIVIDPEQVTLGVDDQIVFVAGDSNLYTVIIPGDKELLASDSFNTPDEVIINDISRGSSAITPAPLPNINNLPDGLRYNVIVTTAGSAFRNDPNAPPRIIINT